MFSKNYMFYKWIVSENISMILLLLKYYEYSSIVYYMQYKIVKYA